MALQDDPPKDNGRPKRWVPVSFLLLSIWFLHSSFIVNRASFRWEMCPGTNWLSVISWFYHTLLLPFSVPFNMLIKYSYPFRVLKICLYQLFLSD